MSTARRLATYDDVLSAPPNHTAELVHGELRLSPRPALRHASIAARLMRRMSGVDPDDDDPPGWVVLPEPECHLGQPVPRSLVLVPDLAAWRAERAPDIATAGVATAAPDWICEILSPSTARYDRLAKMDLYASAGVAWAWLVNPEEQVVEVFRLHDGAWLRVASGGGEDTLTALPFDLTIPLRRLWA
jgi:Uma2 family endonuclease